jgi:hypothetical protein
MIWRERRVPLIVIAALLLGNVFFFFTYRVQSQNRLQDFDARMHEAQARLEQAQQTRAGAEQQIAAYRRVQTDLQSLYNERWSTQPQRLTAFINEVQRLAIASQLVPRSYAFMHGDERAGKQTGIGTNTVEIAFTVQGTYEQVRRLINLLELSNQFVIIDGIGLAGGNSDLKNLTLSIRVKTLFREPAVNTARASIKQS